MLKVSTYNIHKAHSILRGCHLSLIRQGLIELDADIVCLQEVQELNAKRRSTMLARHNHSQLAALQGDRYTHMAYGANAFYEHGHHGNAILSKFPIRTWQNIDVSDHRLEQRGILHAVVAHPKLGDIHVICAHFGLFKVSRVRQAQALIHHVNHAVPRHAPLVVAGDFNDWNLHVHQLLARGIDVVDAIESVQKGLTAPMHSDSKNTKGRWRKISNISTRAPWVQRARQRLSGSTDGDSVYLGRTFPARLPWFKLDRMYVRQLQVIDAQVEKAVVWKDRSDHAPITAYLEGVSAK